MTWLARLASTTDSVACSATSVTVRFPLSRPMPYASRPATVSVVSFTLLTRSAKRCLAGMHRPCRAVFLGTSHALLSTTGGEASATRHRTAAGRREGGSHELTRLYRLERHRVADVGCRPPCATLRAARDAPATRAP